MSSVATFLTQLFLLLCLVVSPYLAHAEEPDAPPIALSSDGKININTASAALLSQTLKGIGLKKAQAIVDYRESYGNFAALEELESVKGIGKSILAKNLNKLSLE